jgi:hypothetical protein
MTSQLFEVDGRSVSEVWLDQVRQWFKRGVFAAHQTTRADLTDEDQIKSFNLTGLA